jgi:23S rRNA (guanine745-N1)-methyltransferase
VVVVTPTPSHLQELAEFGALAVEPEKEARLHAQLAPLRPVRRRCVEFAMDLSADEAAALIAMGPSAHHDTRAVSEAIAVTGSVYVETFSRS